MKAIPPPDPVLTIRYVDHTKRHCGWPLWPHDQSWDEGQISEVLVCAEPAVDPFEVRRTYCAYHAEAASRRV